MVPDSEQVACLGATIFLRYHFWSFQQLQSLRRVSSSETKKDPSLDKKSLGHQGIAFRVSLRSGF